MGEIVEGIDTPFIAGSMMFRVADPIEQRIAQIEIGVRQINFGSQNVSPIGEFPSTHPAEQIEIFGDRPVAIRTRFAGLCQRASQLPDFLR